MARNATDPISELERGEDDREHGKWRWSKVAAYTLEGNRKINPTSCLTDIDEVFRKGRRAYVSRG